MSIFEAALPEEMAGALPRDADQAAGRRAADAGRDRAQGARRGARPALARRGSPSFDDTPGGGRLDRPGAPGGLARRPRRRRQDPVPRRRAGAAVRPQPAVADGAAVSAGWIPGIDIKPLIDELKARVRRGARLQPRGRLPAALRQAFAGDPRFAVPDVRAPAASTSSSAEWIDGTPLSRDHRRRARPSERDAGAERYLEFLLAGPARAGLLHADPHPGNFRMLPDGRLGVLDFGAVNRLPDGLPPAMGPLLDRGAAGDAAGVLERAARRRASSSPRSTSTPRRCWTTSSRSSSRCCTDEFTFSRAWLRGLFGHVNDSAPAAVPGRA